MPSKKLSAREALAIAYYRAVRFVRTWESIPAHLRELHRGTAREAIVELRRLGFTIVPLAGGKGGKRVA